MKTKLKPEVFKAIRLKLGMTQAEMAVALGISRVSVNHMETNKLRKGIPDRIPAKLAELAGVQWEPGGGAAALPQAAEDKPPRPIRKHPALAAPYGKAAEAELWDNEEED